MKPRAIGKAVRERNIASGKNSNYASMIYAVLDKDGNEVRWEHEIITRLEAHERLSANHKKAGEKVLVPTETETRKFKFSLRKNEMLLADGPNGDRVLYRVQSISVGETQLCPNNLSSIQGKARSRWNQIRPCDNLRKYKARKVNVDPLGEITEEDSL
jgi:CRISPR-associated endonuclease Csn1